MSGHKKIKPLSRSYIVSQNPVYDFILIVGWENLFMLYQNSPWLDRDVLTKKQLVPFTLQVLNEAKVL